MLCNSASNGTDQYQNSSSNLVTPYREQPRSTRIVVIAYPLSAFSATEQTNYAPTSFDQVQVSQGHTSYKNKEKNARWLQFRPCKCDTLGGLNEEILETIPHFFVNTLFSGVVDLVQNSRKEHNITRFWSVLYYLVDARSDHCINVSY